MASCSELSTDKLNCSCLIALLGLRNLNSDKIIGDLVELDVNYADMHRDEFRTHYKNVTNEMVRDSDAYKALNDEEREALELKLKKRCGSCGVNLLPLVQMRQNMMEAA